MAINVTIDDDATSKSFLTVWPKGDPKPLASTNNAEPGFISPVSALMKVGTDGMISVFNQQGSVNVIIDVTGYFARRTTPPRRPDRQITAPARVIPGLRPGSRTVRSEVGESCGSPS